MYKVSEVSQLLGIEKTEIFAKMISHKHLLEPQIVKKDGITYFNEKGYEILGTLFNVKQVTFEVESSYINDYEDHIEHTLDSNRSKPLSRFEKEYTVLKDKIKILTNELDQLDCNIDALDLMIDKYQSRLIEELDQFTKLQSSVIKKIEKSLE